jgi:hypothetical protein
VNSLGWYGRHCENSRMENSPAETRPAASKEKTTERQSFFLRPIFLRPMEGLASGRCGLTPLQQAAGMGDEISDFERLNQRSYVVLLKELPGFWLGYA